MLIELLPVVTGPVSLVVSVATLAHRRRAARSEAEDRRTVAELQKRATRDKLVELLRTQRDPHYLRTLMAEAEELGSELAIEPRTAYYCNPVVALPMNWPGERVVTAVLESLGDRYGHELSSSDLRDLADFSVLCHSGGVSREPVVDLIVNSMIAGNEISDSQLSSFLAKNRDLAPAFLGRLDGIHLDLRTWPAGNILYAVTRSLNKAMDDRWTSDPDLQSALAGRVASLLHRQRLNDLATWDDENRLSISAEMCAAALVSACSHVAGVDRHLTWRMTENLPRVLRRFDQRFAPEPAAELVAAFDRMVDELPTIEPGPNTMLHMALIQKEVDRLSLRRLLNQLRDD